MIQTKVKGWSIGMAMVFVLVGNTGTVLAKDAKDTSEDLQTYSLEEVVVTATRTPENISKVPASVTVVTQDQIAKKNAVTITDALKDYSGIFVSRPKGLADNSGDTQIRGFADDSILVLYDGMPMNNAYDGDINWAAIPIDNVAKIEIVRGAASSLYGGRAVGGVINIISKNPPEHFTTKVGMLYGSNGTWRKDVSVGQQATPKFGYNLSYEQRITSGHHTKPASTTSSGSAKSKGTIGTGVVVSKKVDGSPRYIIGSTGNNGAKGDTYNGKLKYNFDANKSLVYAYTHDEYSYWADEPESYIKDAAGNTLFTGSVKLPTGKWFNFNESNFTDYYGRKKRVNCKLNLNNYNQETHSIA